jgi:16S rRNA (guanine527-N7)-methyltransferase
VIASESEARAFVAKWCDEVAIERIEQYLIALAEENTRQNLVSPATLPIAWQRHVADSVQLLAHVPRETSNWLDLGSGPGIPGLILAIARPNAAFTLVESRKRRYEWLQEIVAKLNIRNCRIFGGKLESMESESFQAICARAFAPLPKLLDLSRRFSTVGTRYVLPKGRSAGDELQRLSKRMRELFHVEQSLTDPDAGILVGTMTKAEAGR